MNSFFALAVFFGAALLSALLVEVIRRWALRGERYDLPNERSSHTIPTPRGGGLAIVIVTLSGWLLFNFFVRHKFDAYVWAYPIGAALIASVSWIDDLRGLSNSVRFAVHSIAAILAIAVYGYWKTVYFPESGQILLGSAGVLFTFLWIVWLTNAYNFMDGIDGIAGMQALVAGLGWFALTSLPNLNPIGLEAIPLLSSLLAASSFGFLIHNRPPARIFMGDVGSAFLGYSFAITPLLLHGTFYVSCVGDPADHTGLQFLLLPAILLVWPFLFDTIFTFIRRAMKRENVFKAHRSHLFQRLVIAGCSHRYVTLLYGALAVEGAFLAFQCLFAQQILAYLVASMLGLWAFTRFCEIRAQRAALQAETQNQQS